MLVKKMNETKQETSDEGKQNYWFRDLEESLEIKKDKLVLFKLESAGKK